MVGWHHWFNGHELEQAPGDSEEQGSLACCSPWGRKEPTRPSDWTKTEYCTKQMQLSSAMNMYVQYLFRFLLWLLSGVYPGVKLLDHVVIVCLLFWGVSFCSPEWLHYFTCYQPCTGFRFLHIFTNTCYFLLLLFFFLILAILMGMKWGDWFLNLIWFCCSIAQSCPTLCSPMDSSTPGSHVLHHLPEAAQTHVYWVSDAIQPPHPLVAPFSSCPQNTCMILQNKIYRGTSSFCSWMENPPSCSFPSFQ